MTDKQIIIDGVDVSGCTHKKNDACMAITDLSGDFCYYCDDEIMKDCYYKQLKRAENQIVELNKKVEAKEQECEELKEEKQGLIKDWEEKKNLAYEISCKNEKLKQTLAEIKTDILDIRVGISYFWVTDKCDEILQKISEVIE